MSTVNQKKAERLFKKWEPWLRHEAEGAATPGLRVMACAEFLNAPREPGFVTAEKEDAYRRGYWQGYSTAMDDLREADTQPKGVLWQRVAEWFDTKLTIWRYRRRPRYERPPEFEDWAEK